MFLSRIQDGDEISSYKELEESTVDSGSGVVDLMTVSPWRDLSFGIEREIAHYGLLYFLAPASRSFPGCFADHLVQTQPHNEFPGTKRLCHEKCYFYIKNRVSSL